MENEVTKAFSEQMLTSLYKHSTELVEKDLCPKYTGSMRWVQTFITNEVYLFPYTHCLPPFQ